MGRPFRKRPEPALPSPRQRPIDPERVVAVTRILDEADIVEAFVRHTAVYVQHHVFYDNGSTDGTIEILKALSSEGLNITVLQAVSPAFREVETNTLLFREAAGTLGAGWVVHLDADEFIDDRKVQGGFNRALAAAAAADPAMTLLHVPMTTYVYLRSDDASEPVVPTRMRHRVVTGPVMKAILRGDLLEQGVVVGPGNHDAILPTGITIAAASISGLVYAHYHERSPIHLLAKCVKGWSKILSAGPAVVASGTNYHYRPLFEALRDRPESFLRDQEFLTNRSGGEQVIDDPIDYRGGPLRYTGPVDHEMRAVRSLIGQLECVSTRYGRLVAESPEASRLADRWDRAVDRLSCRPETQ